MWRSTVAFFVLSSSLVLFFSSLVVTQNTNCNSWGCLGEPVCEEGTILTPNVTLGNCCPGCVAYVDLNGNCANGAKCKPGLECLNGKCRVAAKGTCESYKFRDFLWVPKCEPDGSFSAVQCKGERLTGRCFCYSELGKRLFGQQWWSKAENMTCACSRKIEELKKKGRVDVTLHCTSDGNFDTLQCDSGICWCADEKTGLTLGEVVPQPMIELLPCYNKTVVGDSYVRKCDSAAYSLGVIRDEMNQHGTLGDLFVGKNCGYDGSYGEYQFEGGQYYCTWKDNSKIGSFMAGTVPVGGLDCYCAWDSRYFKESGYGFTMQCAGSGSYITLQQLEGQAMCVDRDGFAFKNATLVGEAYTCPTTPPPLYQ
ncbi:uncharacterized protein LOC132193659 [Neocloeon triangulifer]|uniref:uncharacterized protein LOC132193659 n=1 Tax=Neocloeon triangulifer TaxID=2078957 RepID=UPI00286F63CB|nr:uncharacterized protein LOC132193659 [Neocloeon triangulifer]